ncbi:MAG: MFS transporter [Deltaproteobacteria bacterium]|nr:MFS transporter [Deltaproteobacteria bacterium]
MMERLWTRNFVTVSVINFLVFLVHLLLMVIIASYAVDRFHASTSMAGLVASVFIIGALIGRFTTGRFIEDIGNKKVLIIGSVFFVTTALLYFAAVTLPLLIAVRLLHGIAHGIASTATGTIVAKIIPGGRRGEGIGYYGMSIILASALGPFLGILLIHYVDFRVIFLAASLLALLVFLISFMVPEPISKAPDLHEEKPVKRFHIAGFFEAKAIPVSIISLIIGFSGSIVIAFISLYSKEIHLEKAASIYFVVSAIATLVSRPLAGRLFDLRGENFVVYPCIFLYALGMFLFSQAGQGITLLAAGAIIGLGYGNFMSSAQTIAIKSVRPHRFGLATATYYVFLDLGISIGPYLLGSLIPFTGFRGLYLLMAILALTTLPLYYFLHGRKASSR